MKRVPIIERPNKLERFEEIEFSWHEDYWKEDAFWHFSAEEVDKIEEATLVIKDMAYAAIDHVINNYELAFFGYEGVAAELIKWSWEDRTNHPTLMTRLDLAWGEGDHPKLLEINGDTPTSLYEAGVVQWDWLETAPFSEVKRAQLDQFNSVHDKLAAALAKLAATERTTVWEDGAGRRNRMLHSTSVTPHPEDEGTCWYVRYLAEEQGLLTKHVPVDMIGWNKGAAGLPDRFVDQDGLDVKLMYKLYPWEWLLNDQFGVYLRDEVMSGRLTLIEPPWKMLLSNKRLLKTMWDLFPFNPFLLQTVDAPLTNGKYVKKPTLGREGQGVSIRDGYDVIVEAVGEDEFGEFIYQEYTQLMSQDGYHAVIGSWIINGEAAGMGIRESKSLVTNNMGSFVPHVFTEI